MKELIDGLGLGAKEAAGFKVRVDQLSEYLRHSYRRSCTNILTAGCQGGAAFCIQHALSGEGEFECRCTHVGAHDMRYEEFNEVHYLIEDLKTVLDRRRATLQARLDAIEAAAVTADRAAATPAVDPTTASPTAENPEAANIADQLAELDERSEDLASCAKNLDLYTRHLLRKALSSTITIELLEELKSNLTRVHLIIDYKQKILPERHRATQTEAFGKRGKSLHGATVLRWDVRAQDFNGINIRVACDDANQTWFHTLNALRTTLDEVVKLWADVDEATMQSDGANNYDCTAFMCSAPDLFNATSIKLRRHAITEVGDGKNLTDTDFQQAQSALNQGLDGGRDFEDAQVLPSRANGSRCRVSPCTSPIVCAAGYLGHARSQQDTRRHKRGHEARSTHARAKIRARTESLHGDRLVLRP